MGQETNDFQTRLDRIKRGKRGAHRGTGFVVHADGIVTSIGRPSSRLRFGFPIKGLLAALLVAVAVKAYLMWALGAEAYIFHVATLLDGSGLERTAGLVLMPDGLTVWMTQRYDEIDALIQGGLSARKGS